jgi:SAM-dependent methyltransferase
MENNGIIIMQPTIPKEFNPKITQSYYLARKKLLSHISNNAHYLNGHLMDFGCGSKPYKSLFEVTKYTGVDFNGDGHSHVNEQIDFFYDGKTLPFESNFFDSVFSSEVFEHVFNLEEIIIEINRVMKPGATILVTCPFTIAEHEVPNDFARYTSFGLKSLFTRNGFEVKYYRKIGTSIEAIMQSFISYCDSYILSKLNKIKPVKAVVHPATILFLNVLTISLNFILPKRQDSFLNHIIVCKKR